MLFHAGLICAARDLLAPPRIVHQYLERLLEGSGAFLQYHVPIAATFDVGDRLDAARAVRQDAAAREHIGDRLGREAVPVILLAAAIESVREDEKVCLVEDGAKPGGGGRVSHVVNVLEP